jgi:hypothetical protein
MRVASVQLILVMINAAGLLMATGCSCSGPANWAQRSPTIPPSGRSPEQPALAAAPASQRPAMSTSVVSASDPIPQN